MHPITIMIFFNSAFSSLVLTFLEAALPRPMNNSFRKGKINEIIFIVVKMEPIDS